MLDAAEVPLQIPICSSLKDLVNFLASGNVPVLVSKYLAGGSLTALMKDKADLSLDIRPIAVREALCRLVGKCLCAVERSKASDFFCPSSICSGQSICSRESNSLSQVLHLRALDRRGFYSAKDRYA